MHGPDSDGTTRDCAYGGPGLHWRAIRLRLETEGERKAMDFGLFSNGERTNKLAADTYDEDLYEVMLADRLGFKEAWISEHVGRSTGGRADTLPVADMFIIKAAALTKQIKMGPGVRPIAIYH